MLHRSFQYISVWSQDQPQKQHCLSAQFLRGGVLGGGAPLARPPPAQPRQLCSSVARCQSAGEHLLWPQLQQHVTTAPTTPQQQVRHLALALASSNYIAWDSSIGQHLAHIWCELWASRTVWKIIFHLSHLISILMTSTLLLLLSVGLKFRFESSPAWVFAVISLFSLYLFKTFSGAGWPINVCTWYGAKMWMHQS